MKNLTHLGVIAVVAALALPVSAKTVQVTNGNDSGPGSFRDAVAAANQDATVTLIRFRAIVSMVALDNTVVYDGEQSLSIDGSGTDIVPNAPGMFDLFAAIGGGDLTLKSLGFRQGANGIRVDVPAFAEGKLSVTLFEVTVEDNARFGLLIDDQIFASSASIWLDVFASRFIGNGLEAGSADLDGVRVNEGGDGDIVTSVHSSAFNGNGADGLELDEDDAGEVTLRALQSSFDGNGQNPADTDDGLDIDEDATGGIWVQIAQSTFNDHTDDGIGLDEAGEGNIHLDLVQVEASRNGDSGISVDEGDAGDFVSDFVLISADDNADDGADLEEAGEGDFDGRVVASSLSGNADDGISVTQQVPGAGALSLVQVTLDGNGGDAINADGVEVIEVPAS